MLRNVWYMNQFVTFIFLYSCQPCKLGVVIDVGWKCKGVGFGVQTDQHIASIFRRKPRRIRNNGRISLENYCEITPTPFSFHSLFNPTNHKKCFSFQSHLPSSISSSSSSRRGYSGDLKCTFGWLSSITTLICFFHWFLSEVFVFRFSNICWGVTFWGFSRILVSLRSLDIFFSHVVVGRPLGFFTGLRNYYSACFPKSNFILNKCLELWGATHFQSLIFIGVCVLGGGGGRQWHYGILKCGITGDFMSYNYVGVSYINVMLDTMCSLVTEYFAM